MNGVLLIAVVILFFILLNFRNRLVKLERSLQSKSSGSEPVHRPQSAAIEQPSTSAQPPQPEQPWVHPQKKDSTPNVVDHFVDWVKEDWLLKLGALLLLIAFGWFASYAFLHNWIGPMGRIMLGIAAGAAFMAFGTWRIHKYVQQGSVFLILGSTVILLTLFAAREIYNFFTPVSVLVAMFITAAFIGFMSVRVKSKTVGIISMILSGVAPLFTNASSSDYLWLFSYLVIVVVGVLWVVSITRWSEMTLAALILIVAYSTPYLTPSSTAAADVLWFVYGLTALFFTISFVGILKGDKKSDSDDTTIFDLITATGSGLLLLLGIWRAAPQQWQSMILLGVMVVYVVAAYTVLKKLRQHRAFFVYVGMSIIFLAAATALEFDGPTLTIMYTIEGVLIPVIMHYALHDSRITQQFSLLLLGPIILSGYSIGSNAWDKGVLHGDFFVLVVLSAVLFACGLYFVKWGDKSLRQLSYGTVILGSIYAYTLLWLSLHATPMKDDIATMISLVVYTLAGLATHFYGKLHQRKGFEYYGSIVLGCVVARLLLVEVWDMEITGRIITFFLIGTLLVSTAFIGRKKKTV